MSDLRGKAAVYSVTRPQDDDKWTDLRTTRDGCFIDCDWLMGMAMEGRVWVANAGTGTTPIEVNAGYTAAKPDLLITVPSGTTIIPVFIETSIEDTGSAATADVMFTATDQYDNSVTATTTLTPYNLKLNSGRTTACSAYSKVTAGSTTPLAGNYVEFARGGGGIAEDAFNGNTSPTNELISRFYWGAKEALIPPVIVGEGSLYVYTSCTAGISFITVMWVEISTTSLV